MISKKARAMKWSVRWVAFLMLCVGLYLNPTSSDAKDILIGLSQDITGIMAAEGRTHTDASLMAIEEWNAKGGIKGQKIESVFMNHGGDPVRATGNAKILKDKGVCFVHGGSNSTVAIAEMKVLAPAQIPATGGAASTAIYQEKGPEGKPYYFSGVGADPILARGHLDAAAVQGLKKVAILYLNVAWPRDIMLIMKEWVEREYGPKYGMSIIGTIEADVNASDLSLQVNQFRAMNPDVIIAPIYQANSLALARALNDANWRPPLVINWSNADKAWEKASDKKIFYNLAGPSYYDGNRPDALAKRAAFVKKYGYEPTAHWAPTYDCMNLALTAIQDVGPDPVAIRNWLATKAYGKPGLICGKKGMTCKFQDKEETWIGKTGRYYSLYDGTDYAFVWINKEGQIDWSKLNK